MAADTSRLQAPSQGAPTEAPPSGSPDGEVPDFRALLEQERQELLGKLAELGVGDGQELHYDPNFADSSQVTAERGEVEALAQTLREALDEVERALAKLDEGTYGICEVCGRPIATARLEAKPAARRCIDCASKGKTAP
ncbi:TraR/DksA family transcriptional regulator [Aciditerrimonas ferrireducens]|uniref:TraR/DksA family transcriptional regulator n=1 Tax=Aciditerrimonas ferrireducens TaxID=667306 RepID=UPI00200533C6|nr:TraR/DksA C4-type zinc finger protein [Aciditerrimonas ferrireducens]MCK4176702.1 TraR/DksA C4-type zinc finger protein [Aciditerrimonas ferrireducens]